MSGDGGFLVLLDSTVAVFDGSASKPYDPFTGGVNPTGQILALRHNVRSFDGLTKACTAGSEHTWSNVEYKLMYLDFVVGNHVIFDTTGGASDPMTRLVGVANDATCVFAAHDASGDF